MQAGHDILARIAVLAAGAGQLADAMRRFACR